MIRKTGRLIFVCQECEATWLSGTEIIKSGFVDFGTYMEDIGLDPLWSELDVDNS
ncbi:hypothetical protein [Herbaspirillum rubrisubalbicans]|nr:hypothetical protein [Herbaspirillum rubrisubalbicans]